MQSDGAGGDGALHHDGARALERELRRVVAVDVGLKTNLVVQGLNTAWESDRQKLRHQEVNRVPSNHAGSIRKCTGYGQLWPLRPACGQNRAGSYMPDPTSRIRFSSVFPKKAWTILCKTDPGPIRMAWSGFGQHIWSGSKPVRRNHGARFLAERNRPATSLPLRSWFGSSTDGPDHVMRNQPGSDLALAASVGF